MNINNLKYIRYSRKSSEAKEKQALSIQDQNKEADIYSSREEIIYTYKFEESKTAFKPQKRPYFEEMLRLINEGQANCIVTWKEDRLCRNPKEGGEILQLLQDGILKEIRCVSSNTIYTQDSDHLILQIHFGMANQYSRNLSQNVKRGIRRKILDRKEYPRPAIIGYESYGERGARNIRPHPIESLFVKKAFEMASTGLYSLNQISNILKNEGFRSKKGKFIGKSHIEQILKKPTYYGYFLWNNELFEGNYEPLISKGLFDLVQERLGDRSRPKKEIWDREFANLLKCGYCKCAITTTIKKKYIKKAKQWKIFTYHHCTHRRGSCKEKPVTDSELKLMLFSELDKISIDDEVWQLGIKLIQSKYNSELEKNKSQLQYIHQQQESTRDQISRLIEMRASNELTKEEFLEQKNRLVGKISDLDNRTLDNSFSVKTWLELTEDFFNTAFQVRDVLENGTTEQKQNILKKVGENFILQEKKLSFSFKKPYDVLLNPEYRKDVLGVLDSNQNKQLQRLLSYR